MKIIIHNAQKVFKLAYYDFNNEQMLQDIILKQNA